VAAPLTTLSSRSSHGARRGPLPLAWTSSTSLAKTAVGNSGGLALVERHGFGLFRSDEKYAWWRHGFLLV